MLQRPTVARNVRYLFYNIGSEQQKSGYRIRLRESLNSGTINFCVSLLHILILDWIPLTNCLTNGLALEENYRNVFIFLRSLAISPLLLFLLLPCVTLVFIPLLIH